MSKKWYVVHAYSGFEKNVSRALKERVALSSLDEYFGEILVPTEEVVEMRGGQKRRSERKFFPGYVLVEMELNDETWHLVKETPRVMGFIGCKAAQPAPLSEAEANAILDRVAAGSEKASHSRMWPVVYSLRLASRLFSGDSNQRVLKLPSRFCMLKASS